MIDGTFHDGFAWATLILPTMQGDVPEEFVVDTGFEGDLKVPARLAVRLQAEFVRSTDRMLADGTTVQVSAMRMEMPDYLQRPVEVLVMEGNPLIGTVFLRDQHLHIEMTDGGDVYSEPL